MKRTSLKSEPTKQKLSYFVDESQKPMGFIHSGSSLLDLVLGGGWPLGRISNIVGDESTGKTLLAIEACTNFFKQYPDGVIVYKEAEAAFDKQYAATLNMPVNKIDFAENVDDTIEDIYEYIKKTIDKCMKKKVPGLIIIDSLDAIYTKGEEKEELKDSFGLGKQKLLSRIFRLLSKKIEAANIHLMVISQVRAKIGALFGVKKTYSGGQAMKHYATHILWLSEIGRNDKTIRKIKRIVSLDIKAKCTKNKIGLAFRECQFPLVFGYGVDDITSCLEWLELVDEDYLKKLYEETGSVNLVKCAEILKHGKYPKTVQKLKAKVKKEWEEIETSFLPSYSKY